MEHIRENRINYGVGGKEGVKSNIKYHLSVKVLIIIKDYQEQIMKIC